MDEEFFFPQNVKTSYRLWILGPKHLRRLAGVPVVALLEGLPLIQVSVLLAALVAGFLGTAWAVTICLPLLGDDQTLSDVGLEIYRHRRRQTRFQHAEEVDRPGHVA